MASMDTIGSPIANHHMGSLGSGSPDSIEKTQLQWLLLLR